MVNQDLVLKHKTRRMIYNHILAHPGVSFNILKDVFDLTSGTLRYHLDYLNRAEKIFGNLENGKRIYYPTNSGTNYAQLADRNPVKFKFNSNQEHILEELKLYSRLNQKELVKRTKLNRFKIRNNVERLIEIGIVKKVIQQNIVYYEYLSEGQKQFEIVKVLVKKLLNNEIDNKTFLELINRVK